MSNEILNGSNFNVEEITYSPLRVSPQGGKNIKLISKVNRRWIMMTTPLMDTYGASDYVDPNTGIGNGKYSMSLLFRGSSEDTQKFLENMTALEDKIKRDALKHSKEWFGKLYTSSEVLEALWSPMLKYPKEDSSTSDTNKTKPPYLNVKLQKYSDKWNCEVYDERGNIQYPLEDISASSPLDLIPPSTEKRVRCVLQCGGIWITNGKFTVTWELKQVAVQAQAPPLMGQKKCYVPIVSHEDNVSKPKLSRSTTIHLQTEENIITAQESDDDEEGECSSREGKPVVGATGDDEDEDEDEED
jgi:hypothetical protein